MRFNGNELKYIEEVLNSNMKSATSGAFTERLEKEFTKKTHTNYAIAHNSGTSALHTALMACGIKTGDEVITTALTVAMDAFAIKYVGAIPIYADVNPATFNINPDSIEKNITSKTKAIIVVHLYGNPCLMDSIMEIAEQYCLPVIEDCAQTYSTYKGKMCGSIGDIGIFSFENSKHISTGEGGMSITNNKEIATKIRKYAGLGFKNLTANSGRIKADESVFQNPHLLRHDVIGYNYRLPELCSAVALAQLERLDEIVKKRQEIARMYMKAIQDCHYMTPQFVVPDHVNSYWTFAVRYTGKVKWEYFREAYIKNCGDGFYGAWALSYKEPALKDNTVFCPVAEYIQPQLMQFKTNYQDLDFALQKALALELTIEEISQ